MGQSLPTWSIVQSRRTKNLFWNCKFKGRKLQISFTRRAIKDWNGLQDSIKNKEQKKDFKSNKEQKKDFKSNKEQKKDFKSKLIKSKLIIKLKNTN